MAGKRRRTYAWALASRGSDQEVRRLSLEGREGFYYAEKLARNALERRDAALAGSDILPEPLTLATLARDNATSAATVARRISQARIELFGDDLGDRAIQYRLRKRRHAAPPRLCAEPGCSESMDRYRAAQRRYCKAHATPAARVARHRRRLADRGAGSG